MAYLFTLHHREGSRLNEGDYTPFSVGASVSAQVFDETHLYLPGARRFWTQGDLPAETDVYELRDRLQGYPFFHSLVLGGLARLTGSLEKAWVVAQGVGAAFLWLGVLLLVQLFAPLVYSSAAAWITVLFAFGPRHALLQGADALYQPLELVRLPHPAISFGVLLAATLAAIRVTASPGRLRAFVLGMIGGLLFSVYYFYSVGFFLAALLVGITLLLLRDFAIAGRLVLFGLGSFVSALPYFLRVWIGWQQGDQKQLMERVGTFTHAVSLPSAVISLGIFAVFVLWVLRCRPALRGTTLPLTRAALLWFYALLAAGGLGISLHAVTGYDAQHTHFFNRLIQPMVCVLGLVTFWQLLGRHWRTLAQTLVATVAVILIALAGYRQKQVALNTHEDHRLDTPDHNLLGFLRTEAAGKVVATTDPSLALLLPGVAGSWVYVPVADRTMASGAETLRRYLTVSKLEQRTLDATLRRLARRAPDDARLWLHTPYVFFQSTTARPDLEEQSRKIWDKLDPAKELASRRLDFLVLPGGEMPESLLEMFPGAQSTYSSKKWRVVTFPPPSESPAPPPH